MNATLNPKTLTMKQPMQAIEQRSYGPVDVMRLAELERPAVGESEVLIRTHAAGLDRGTWHMMTGRPYLMRVMGFGFRRPHNPVPGLDIAGTVVEVGAKVTRFAVGDAVFGIAKGSFAEYACAREDKLAHKPKGLSFQQAAVLGVSGLTALQSVRAAGIEAGQRVLIVGASGGVGTYAVQIAKALGAHVTGVCSTSKVELVRSIGADEVIDYTTGDLAEGDVRYDAILDVGGNTPLARLRRVLAPKGVLVFVGGENGGDWTAGFGRPLSALLLGLFVSQRFKMFGATEHYAGLEELAQLVDAGKLAPVIDRTVPLKGVVDAMRELEAGRVRGKIAISVAENSR